MYAVYCRIGAAAVAIAVAFWMGHRVAAGSYEERIALIATGITESQNAAIDRANQAAEAAAKRSAAAERRRTEQRKVSTEVGREIAQDTNRTCEWRDTHRMRIEALYRNYGYQTGTSDGVPSAVPEPAKLDVTP